MKCSTGKGGNESLWKRFIVVSDKKDWGESVSELMILKNTRNCTHYSLTWVFLPFVHVLF